MLVLHFASTNLVSAKSVCKCGNGEVDSSSKKVSIVIGLFSVSLATRPFSQCRDSSCQLWNVTQSEHFCLTPEDLRITRITLRLVSLVFDAPLCPPTRCSLFQRALFTLLPIRRRPLLRDASHTDYIGVKPLFRAVCRKSTLGLFYVYTSTT